jgi:hypothetical protein
LSHSALVLVVGLATVPALLLVVEEAVVEEVPLSYRTRQRLEPTRRALMPTKDLTSFPSEFTSFRVTHRSQAVYFYAVFYCTSQTHLQEH